MYVYCVYNHKMYCMCIAKSYDSTQNNTFITFSYTVEPSRYYYVISRGYLYDREI